MDKAIRILPSSLNKNALREQGKTCASVDSNVVIISTFLHRSNTRSGRSVLHHPLRHQHSLHVWMRYRERSTTAIAGTASSTGFSSCGRTVTAHRWRKGFLSKWGRGDPPIIALACWEEGAVLPLCSLFSHVRATLVLVGLS